MFGKMMNNYYYGKSGKGDYRKEDLPHNRWQLFFEMLRIRFSALVRLNLMYMLIWLPTMIVLMMGAMGMLSSLSDSLTPAEGTAVVEQAGDTAASDAAAQTADTAAASDTTATAGTGLSVSEMLQGLSMSTLLLLIPCIAITGPFTAGVSYVTRNWARDEHAFIWSDFKDAVKDNWKQGLAISAITSIVPLLVYVCWNFYGQMAQSSTFMIVPQVLTLMIGVIWALAVTYFYPLMVTYKLKMRDLFRNGFLLAVARLPQSAGIRLLHCVPTLIAAVVAFFFNPVWAVLGLFLYYLVMGYSLSRFITASYTNGVFDRFINCKIEGVEVNRGLNTEDEDDDEGDSDSQDEQ